MQSIHVVMLAVVLIMGCGKREGTSQGEGAGQRTPVVASGSGSKGSPADINGAGATFPYPLYSKWISTYHKAHPDVRINYQSIGSGGGIRQITERTVDFGASDAPMTDEETKKTSSEILHVPMTLGAVAIIYNVPNVKTGLRLTPEVVAGVFLGEITNWNDGKIASLNPGQTLPATPITVIHRSDGSGTTAILTEYLSAVVPQWKDKVGNGKSVRFPVGLGAKGNEGVSGQLKTAPGGFGYAELAYAKETDLTYASLRNRTGNYVEPSLSAITAAASAFAGKLPDDMRTFLVNADGAEAYPLTSFSYILAYRDQQDAAKGKALAEFLWWAAHEGQKDGPPLHYAPLPAEVVKRVETQLRTMTANGRPLLGST